MAEFVIQTDLDTKSVRICIEEEPDFVHWMMATEYLMAVTASRSGTGFEKAMELLMKGACAWRSGELPEIEEDV